MQKFNEYVTFHRSYYFGDASRVILELQFFDENRYKWRSIFIAEFIQGSK